MSPTRVQQNGLRTKLVSFYGPTMTLTEVTQELKCSYRAIKALEARGVINRVDRSRRNSVVWTTSVAAAHWVMEADSQQKSQRQGLVDALQDAEEALAKARNRGKDASHALLDVTAAKSALTAFDADIARRIA